MEGANPRTSPRLHLSELCARHACPVLIMSKRNPILSRASHMYEACELHLCSVEDCHYAALAPEVLPCKQDKDRSFVTATLLKWMTCHGLQVVHQIADFGGDEEGDSDDNSLPVSDQNQNDLNSTIHEVQHICEFVCEFHLRSVNESLCSN